MSDFLKLILPWPARDFNLISDIFVYGILLFFLIYLGIFLWKTWHRSRLISDLTNKVNQHVKPAKPEILPRLETEFNGNNELAEVWHEFQNSLITREPKENQEKIVYKTDEASLFFSEERLLEQHMNLRFWNIVPALLVGLGILGTFVGLVWGLLPFSSIDFQQTENIRSAIQSLLSGVSTAFVTSVWGMLFSLLFNWIEKSHIGSVSSKIAELQRTLDRLFTLTTQEEIAFRQEDELSQQTQALKSFSTDLADKITIAMDCIMAESRDQSTQDSQKIILELHKVPDAISKAVVTQLAPNLNNLDTAVEELQRQSEKLDDLRQSLLETRVQNTHDNQDIIKELRNTPDAISSMMQSNFNHLYIAVENLNPAMKEAANEIKNAIELEKQEITQELRKVPNTISSRMESSLNRLSIIVETLNISIGKSKNEIQSEMVHGKQEMLSQLHDIEEKLVPSLNNLCTIVSDIQSVTEQGRQEVVYELHKLGPLITQVETLAETFNYASGNLTNLPGYVAQIADDIQELLKSLGNQTNEQFNQKLADMDAFLLRAAQILQDVQQSAGTLLQLQNKQMKAITDQLTNSRATLVSGRDILQEMNKSITSLHQITETVQVVSEQLIEGAKRLESAGQKLNQTGVMFNEGNQNSLTVIRETARQIQNTLAESHPMLNSFRQEFQTICNTLRNRFQDIGEEFQIIDDGLNGIFAEIEQGLNSYANTTRESMNKYLTDFSEQFAQASNLLSKNVETLRDSVDELTEMNENQLMSAAKALSSSVEMLRDIIVKLNDREPAADTQQTE